MANIVKRLEDMHPNALTRQDILAFPFPYKLWIVVNLKIGDFIWWNDDGTTILLKVSNMEKYLNDEQSIFMIKDVALFIAHLRRYGFEYVKMSSAPGETRFLLEMKNQYFQRQCLYLLEKMLCRSNNKQMARSQAVDVENKPCFKSMSKFFDLCPSRSTFLSSRQKARTNLTLQTEFRKAEGIREQKEMDDAIKVRDERTSGRGRKRGRPTKKRLPKVCNAADLKDVMDSHGSTPLNHSSQNHSYTGYIGEHADEKIKAFFGEYLVVCETAKEDKEIEVAESIELVEQPSESKKAPAPRNNEKDPSLANTNASTEEVRDINFSENARATVMDGMIMNNEYEMNQSFNTPQDGPFFADMAHLISSSMNLINEPFD